MWDEWQAMHPDWWRRMVAECPCCGEVLFEPWGHYLRRLARLGR